MKNIIITLGIIFLSSVTMWSQENAPNPTDQKNWISNIRYDLKGNTLSKGVGYFNMLGKGTQNQSWDVLTGKVWTSQTMYDNQGRPALQTLSAPVGFFFGYQSSFVLKPNGIPYTVSDFDSASTVTSPSTVGNQANTLGRYYSNDNNSEIYQDITSYPFSRSIFSKLNPGNVLKTIGGNKVKIRGTDQWANGYSFSMPVAQELHYAYGKDHFSLQKVTDETCVTPPSTTTSNDYFYDLTPINVDDCLLNTSDNLLSVRLDIGIGKEKALYDVNKIYKITVSGGENYFKIIKRTQVSSPNNPAFMGFVTCGPYNTCTDVYITANYIKATKTVVRDVHGVENVVFTDSDGKMLAAARSGNENNPTRKKYKVVSPIGEQGFVDIHIPVGCGGNITFVGPSVANYYIYDLVLETKLNGGNAVTGNTYPLNPGMYRIEESENTTYHKNPLPYVKINGSSIGLIDNLNQVAVSYNVNYYDYSLNFYDKPGRLTQSIQPQGFDDALTLSTSTRNHQLTSTFVYNTLGELQSTVSPDERGASFKYRKDGQIRYSQNSLQATNNEFSYTNYDHLGRPIESGVLQSTGFATADPDVVALPSSTTRERHITVYDMPDVTLASVLTTANIPEANYKQQFVAGNVSKTYTFNPSTTTTWYSYDINGRVVWIVQNIDGLGVKTVDYEYDFTQGHVTKVIYQKYNTSELFAHKYSYNISGQLTSVETSTNNITFTEQENYTYFETGALKRKELLGGVQGTDYVYNLNGQLKAINHPSLLPNQDPGGDNDDAFGMLIDYHQNDYARTQRSNITTTTLGTDQFNGNIKTTRWNTFTNALTNPKENAYNYQYDKNNWLESAHYGELVTGNTTNTNIQENVTSTAITTSGVTLNLEATNSITMSPGFHAQSGSNMTAKIYTISSFNQKNNGDYNVNDITYDANGNIKTLKRNKNTESGSNVMDNFIYNYKTGKNQLDYVSDAVITTTNADDLKTQTSGNYSYNSIGQLIQSNENGEVISYSYNASGLVTEIKKNNVTLVKFYYNDKGHRVRKATYTSGGSGKKSVVNNTYYVRDVAGNAISIHTERSSGTTKLVPKLEYPIYGASRVGVYNNLDNSTAYQLTDHLGNVRAVIGKDSNNNMIMLSYTDYYPFGMPMPNRNVEGNYRYKFQGQEKDPETGKEAFQLRLWDARIGRWLTTDPLGEFASPYLGMGNNPISRIDPDGGSTKDWKKDKKGNYVYDSNLTAENAKDLLGKGETYVGKSYYKPGEIYLSEQGNFHDFLTGEHGRAPDTGLSEIVIGRTVPRSNIKGYDYLKTIVTLNSNAFPEYDRKTCGNCAKKVRVALNAGGLDTSDRPIYPLNGPNSTYSAKNYRQYLATKGFAEVSPDNYAPMAGDIIVIQNYVGGNVHGHIQIYNGTQWVSDFNQSGIWPGSGYKKNEPSYDIFR